jgi:membrane protein
MKRLFRLSRHSFGVRNRASWISIIKHSFHYFHENDLFTSAAAMSYFGLITLFPMLLVLLAISNQFPAGEQALTQIASAYPGSSEFLRSTVRSLERVNAAVIVSCAFVVLWAGSWVFAVVERALNRIWNTRPRTFFHGRGLTLAMIGAVGLLLTISLLLTSMLVALRGLMARLPLRALERIPYSMVIGDAFWQLIFAIVSIAVTISLFVLVYRFVPNSEVELRDTLPSAVVGGLLWEAAKYIFASSLHFFHYDQIYGSVGAVVAVLTWGYVSSLVLLFGAQLSAVLHYEHPSPQTAAEQEAVGDKLMATQTENVPSPSSSKQLT